MPVCRLCQTSASAEQYPDAILTAGSKWTHPPSAGSCSGAFSTPPSADPYPYVFATAWPRRTSTLEFSSLLAKKDLYRDVYTSDPTFAPPEAKRTNAAQPARPRPSRRTRHGRRGHRGGRERTCRSRRSTVADANERAAVAGPPWRTRTNAPQPPDHSGGRERMRRSRWGPLQGIMECE
ncbi:hypothetical protein Y032_0002g762 [Ancylostoma ceylanicum]|uniref:Uncharacterized protein n=1 Tax=Ancylostoma ceylanicum TaxID=53326 RepID=A0A016W1A1_9BILA|nr:hypothetical protein Y032_0002g762 [Ancylostoma ceylanicum]